MNELARPLALSSLVALAALACAPDGSRPCRVDDQCEPGESCVREGDEVGACLAVSDDAGLPLDDAGPDGGPPGNDSGVPGDGGDVDGGTDGGPVTPSPRAANDIAVGGGFACARTHSKEAYCWGFNSNGQLGNSNTTMGPHQPTKVASLSDVSAIAAADDHACAIGRAFGKEGVFCWGQSADGELGLPPGQTAGVPHRVGLDDETHASVVDLQTGARSTCVRTSANEVWCWGPGVPGATVGEPKKITQLTGAIRLHVGHAAICARLSTGTLRCLNQTGAVSTYCNAAGGELQCPELATAVDFAITASNICYIEGEDAIGSLHCAGDNRYGVVWPIAPAAGNSESFVPLDEVLDYSSKKVSLGDQHACALGQDSVVRCWGRNLWASTGHEDEDFGRLCANEAARCHEPEAVPNLPRVTDLGTFGFFNCAIAEDGVPWCWGGLGSEAETPAPWFIP